MLSLLKSPCLWLLLEGCKIRQPVASAPGRRTAPGAVLGLNSRGWGALLEEGLYRGVGRREVAVGIVGDRPMLYPVM